MTSVLRAELLKLRTTKSLASLLLATVALVLLAVLLHGFGLDAEQLSSRSNQLRVLTAGEGVGVVFAALVGALSVTAEYRHGTIRPTLLGTPRRSQVVIVKAAVSSLVGLGLGAVAAGLAAAAGTFAFSMRDLPRLLSVADIGQLVVGGAAASALWAAIGLGLGALIRHQVPAVVGIFLWLQIVENLLVDSVPTVSRYMPGALGQALAGSEVGVLSSVVAAASLLVLYMVVVVAGGVMAMARSDVN